MKFVIVTIRRGTDPVMQYPAVYVDSEVDANKQGPIQTEGALGLGEDVEECMILLNNAVADKYASDPDVRLATEAEGDAWLATNRNLAGQPEEVVTNVNRLFAIIAKNEAGVALSQEDLDAVDPDKSVKGINRCSKTCTGIFGVYDSAK